MERKTWKEFFRDYDASGWKFQMGKEMHIADKDGDVYIVRWCIDDFLSRQDIFLKEMENGEVAIKNGYNGEWVILTNFDDDPKLYLRIYTDTPEYYCNGRVYVDEY